MALHDDLRAVGSYSHVVMTDFVLLIKPTHHHTGLCIVLPDVLCRYNGSYMEYDQNAPRQVLCDWIAKSGGVAAAFDFPTKGILQVAAR